MVFKCSGVVAAIVPRNEKGWARLVVQTEPPKDNFPANLIACDFKADGKAAGGVAALTIGDKVDARFAVNSQMYQGKYYTSIKLVGVEKSCGDFPF